MPGLLPLQVQRLETHRTVAMGRPVGGDLGREGGFGFSFFVSFVSLFVFRDFCPWCCSWKIPSESQMRNRHFGAKLISHTLAHVDKDVHPGGIIVFEK